MGRESEREAGEWKDKLDKEKEKPGKEGGKKSGGGWDEGKGNGAAGVQGWNRTSSQSEGTTRKKNVRQLPRRTE